MTDLRWPAAQPTLEAEGVVLRPWRRSDADAVLAACQDPDIVRWTTVPAPYERTHAEAFVGPVSAEAWADKTAVHFAAVDEAGDVVGSFGLVRVNPSVGVTEVGYWVAPWARRRGVARRAAAAVTEWALRDVGHDRVELRAAVGNVGSRRVAECIGFTQEGVMRSAVPGREARLDLVLYSRIASD